MYGTPAPSFARTPLLVIALLSPALLGAETSCGAATGKEESGSVGQPIVDGERDVTHTAVFRILSRKDGGNGLCTGVLIAPELVLTARHCVADTPEDPVLCGQHTFGANLEASELLVSNAVSPNIDSGWQAVREVRVPQAADLCGFDIALLRLKNAVSPETAVPYAVDGTASVQTQDIYTAVGYGAISDAPDVDYGERRARDQLSVACGTGTCPAPTTETEFVGQEGVCNGDSGGPALGVDNTVLGIASRGTENCQTPVYSAVSAWSSWLLSEIERARNQDAARNEDSTAPAPREPKNSLPEENCNLRPAASPESRITLALWALIALCALTLRRSTKITAQIATPLSAESPHP